MQYEWLLLRSSAFCDFCIELSLHLHHSKSAVYKWLSLCQRLDSRQLTKKKTSTGGVRKIECKVRAPKARESASGERGAQRAFCQRRKRFREAESSLYYYGQILIAFKSRYLSKLDTPLHGEAQIYCPTWLSMQQNSFHSFKTLWPEPGYRVSSSRKFPLAACYF